jgi:Zn-dependent protease with chaperone function
VADLAGGDQVTVMNGVEGTAHDTDPSHFFMTPFVPRIVPAQLADTRAMIRDMTSVPDRARVRLTGISSRAYEHPADRSALVALRKLTGFDTLLKLLNGLFNERAMRLNFLASGVKVSERQFPHIYEMLRDGAYVLDMDKVPELYVTQTPLVNAMALGTNTPFIVLNTGLVDLLDAEELRAVIGHELGHVLSGHAVYRTMLYNLIVLATRIAWMPIGYIGLRAIIWGLEEWYRKSELSCDRAGLLAGRTWRRPGVS